MFEFLSFREEVTFRAIFLVIEIAVTIRITLIKSL